MDKKAIEGKGLAPAIGPYSAGIRAGGMIFTSGQIAMNPHTGELEQGANISEETDRVMRNLQAVLLAAGADFSAVVKTSIFLSSMDDFPEVNAVYQNYFEPPYPARETVAVKTLPKNVNVEISCIAMHKG
jgi:2-iminobutanoate/2-iminopropanoate deaminase